MLLFIVIVRHDAEKLKYLPLKKRVAGDVGKNAYHIWFAATGWQGKRDKCESALSENSVISIITLKSDNHRLYGILGRQGQSRCEELQCRDG